MKIEYTKDEFDEFKDLVEAGESQDQMERIRSRLAFPKFVARVGKEKCDVMFEVLIKEDQA